MKKIFAILMILVSVCILGCGGPSPKEEMTRLEKKYVNSGDNTLRNTFQELHNGKYADWSKEYMDAAKAAKSKVDDKILEIEKEDVSAEVQPYLTVINHAYLSFSRFLGYSIEQLNLGQYAQTDDLEAKGLKHLQRMFFDFGYRLPKEACEIKNENGPVLIAYKGKVYEGKSASNVKIAVTKTHVTKDSIGNYYTQASPIGKFVIFKVVVENLQKDAILVDSCYFKIVDQENREYDVSNEAMMTAMVVDGTGSTFLSKLNPRMKREYKFVFDIPEDIDVDNLKLKARGGFSGKNMMLPFRVSDYPIDICKEKLPDIISSDSHIIEDMMKMSEQSFRYKYNGKDILFYGQQTRAFDLSDGQFAIMLGDEAKNNNFYAVTGIFNNEKMKKQAKKIRDGQNVYLRGRATYEMSGKSLMLNMVDTKFVE